MESFVRLMNTVAAKEWRLLIRFDPDEIGEQWGIKLYPDDDDAHFYAYNSTLESTSRQLLDELQDEFKW